MRVRQCSAALVYDNSGDILLVSTMKGVSWVFPKGGLERGLTPMENAAKECREEAGVGCSDKGFSLGSYEFYKRKEDVLNHVEVFALESTPDRFVTSEEREVRWVSFKQALTMVSPYLAPFVLRLADHLEAEEAHNSRKAKQ